MDAMLLLYGVIHWKKHNELFNPWILIPGPILISLVINIIYYDQKYRISSDTYLVYFLSLFVLSIGLWIGFSFRRTIKINEGTYIPHNTRSILWALVLFTSIFALIQIYRGYSSGTYGYGLAYLMNNIRYYTGYIQGNNFFSKYGIVLVDVLMLNYMYNYYLMGDQQSKKPMVLSMLFYLLFTATEFNRTNILYFVSTFGFFVLKKHKEYIRQNKKPILTSIFLFVGLLIVFNVIAQKTGKGLIGADQDPWLVYYFGSEIHWLELFAIKSGIRTNGVLSLGVFGRLLKYIGIISDAAYDQYREMALVYGSPTSSFVSAPYLDFGIAGIIVLFVYGVIIGHIYHNHLYRKNMWSIFYSTCVYQCIIAFYAFQFGLSSQIYVMVILLMICRDKKRMIDKI